MSQENIEVVRSLYAALNRGDREAALGFADPDIEVDASRLVFNPTTYVGMDGLRRMADARDEVWEEFRYEVIDFREAGDRVVVVERLIGKGKGSGVEVDRVYAAIWTVRDGRVVRMEIGYTDPAEALAAVGL